MKYAVIGVIAFLMGIGMGATTSTEAPEATPQIVEVPGPTVVIEPTPRVEIVEVPANLSDACQLAILDLWYMANDAVSELAEVEADYFDYPDETIDQFGRRVEARIVQWQTDFADYEVPDTTVCYGP